MPITGEPGPAHEEATVAGHRRPLVVVGVDGSEPSSKALASAAEEARLRGATLKVVHAWSPPTLIYGAYLPVGGMEDVPTETATHLDAQIAEVLGAHPAVAVEREVGTGPAALVILEAAKDADLVVVGSRGRGGFVGLLLGSVSTQVVQHAHCPVMIVRS